MPVLGILSNRPAQGTEPFGKETRYFARLIEASRERGFLCYVFSTAALSNSSGPSSGPEISGYVPGEDGLWAERAFPFPGVVYDRLIPQDQEAIAEASLARDLLLQMGVRFVNSPRFISLLSDKWLVYRTLMLHRSVSEHLPRTEYFQTSLLDQMLKSKGAAYLKPVVGHQSHGLVHLRLHGSHVLAAHTCRNSAPAVTELEQGPALLHFLQRQMDLDPAKNDYLLQEPIAPALFLGKRFEVRVMMHKDGLGRWLRTGMVVRAATGDMPFLAPGYERHFRPSAVIPKVFGRSAALVLESVRRFARPIPAYLEAHSGPAGELALDVILDKTGKPWLLEANSRPASLFLNVGAHHLRNRGIERILDHAKAIAPSDAQKTAP